MQVFLVILLIVFGLFAIYELAMAVKTFITTRKAKKERLKKFQSDTIEGDTNDGK